MRRPVGARRPLRRRAALVALASASVVLVALAPARARGTTTAPPPPFSNGTASATAIVTRFTPGVGSLPTGLFGGVALTNVTNSVAEAQAKSLDFGLIGALLSALDIVPSSALPSPLTVDNRGGGTSATQDDYPISGSTLGGGHKEARASRVPAASATSTLVNGFGDVVKVKGGRAESTSEVVPGKARQGRASVSVDLDIAGSGQALGPALGGAPPDR